MPGQWKPLTQQPKFNASTMLLLTDGTIMCQESGGKNWWKLTPDAAGSYINGTWSSLAPMHHTRLYYASAVFADGRVFVAGGEYSDAGSDTNTAEIYDPVLNAWTVIPAPAGWTNIGDAPCCVLQDGRLLLGHISDTKTAIYNPATSSWAAGPNKLDASSEETWNLLPDGTVLTAECSKHPHAEKYVPSTNTWVPASSTPGDLVEASSIEIGPALLLPDGRTFAVGATGRTALYHKPPVATQPGSWTAGPTFPKDASKRQLGAKDAPGCLMPNGSVLCVAGPVDGVAGDYLGPSSFFEFDGALLHAVPAPPNGGSVPFVGRMMMTPDGNVLFAAGSGAMYAYVPSGGPNAAWRPQITACPATLNLLGTYVLHGRQLNGLSQAVSYGDDVSSATNYPVIRVRNLATGHVKYCRTFAHSSMGVATGAALETTRFIVPASMPLGPGELTVVANGIPSEPIKVDIQRVSIHLPINEEIWAFLIGSLADGPLWVLGPNGPVPVDPMEKELAAGAQAARAEIVAGIQRLQDLGRVADAQRVEAAAAAPAARDPHLLQAEARGAATTEPAKVG